MKPRPVKVVETSIVTEDELERILCENIEEGWVYDGMQFAMRDNSRRPSMAFLIFYHPSFGRPDLKSVPNNSTDET